MKKVSIIVPVYNSEKYIEKCVNSIINQTYNNIEIILVNDGSKDNSLGLCKYLSSKYENVKYINQDNSGPSDARNAGIDVSSGEFIQFVDADDYIDSDMVSTLVNKKIDNNSDLVICGYKVVYKNNDQEINNYNNIVGVSDILTKKEFLKCFHYFFVNFFINSPCNKLYSSSIIKENKLKFNNSISLGEDLLFNLEYLRYCNMISIEHNCYYNYVQINSTSLTKKSYTNKAEIQNLLFKNVRDFLEANDAYIGENKYNIEYFYLETMFNALTELYKSEYNLKPYEIKHKLKEIANYNQIKKALPYYRDTSINRNIIYLLVKYKQIFILDWYCKLKKAIKKSFDIKCR